MSTGQEAPHYDDGRIACDEHGLLIRRYYPWGDKRIAYADIRSIRRLPLTGLSKVRRWRIWGSGDFRHWWNYDPKRPGKTVALVVQNGNPVMPTITPEDPTEVERLVNERIAAR